MALGQIRPLEVEARDGYMLWVRFDDGVEGEVDLSSRAGRGVFKVWADPGVFESVGVDAAPDRQMDRRCGTLC